jgi:hypothetical protein
LHPRGCEGQPHEVEVPAHDDGESEGVRQAAAVGLAVGGEREHRLDECFEAERGADLRDEAELAIGCVAEPVEHPRLDDDDVAGSGRDRLSADGELGLAGDDLESLRLVRVHVGGRDEAAWFDGDFDQNVVAARVGCGFEEGDVLAGDRVYECVSLANHGYLTFRGIERLLAGQARSCGARSHQRDRQSRSLPLAGDGQPASSMRWSSAREERPSFVKTFRRW